MSEQSQRSVLSRVGGFLILLGGLASLIAPPAVAAPSVPVGRTEGNFSVSSTGTSAYSIPIFTPPGPRGVQPSIALIYSSAADTGPMGKGWSISGLSAITRCGKTLAQDPQHAPVKLQLATGYCLNGNKLRIQSGTYGQAGSVYYTELADFSRITAMGAAGNGPAWFKVEAADGMIYEYGNGYNNARVLAAGSATAISWMVSEIRDRSDAGNRVQFSYVSPSASLSGTTNPLAIEWTAWSQGANSFVNQITFNYAAGGNNPESSITRWVDGTSVVNNDLLTSVDVTVAGATARRYLLQYDPSPTTNAKLLKSVTECAGSAGNECLPPTTVTYQAGQSGFATSPQVALSGSVSEMSARHDLNGDEYPDLLYKAGNTWYVAFGAVAGYAAPVTTPFTGSVGVDFFLGDFRGTGRASVLRQNGSYWWEYMWNGSGFAGVNTGSLLDSSGRNAMLDVDGDGREDLVVATWTTQTATIKVQRNTTTSGSVTFAAPVTAATISKYAANIRSVRFAGPGLRYQATTFVDFNADRREDVLVNICEATFSSNCNEGSSDTRIAYKLTAQDNLQLSAEFIASRSGSSPYYRSYYVNWNDDQCMDVITNQKVYVSGCAGAAPSPLTISDRIVGTADVNGDGRTDALVAETNQTTLSYRLSTSSGVGIKVTTAIPYSTNCEVVQLDRDANGLDDIGCFNSSATPAFKIYAHNGGNTWPDLAVQFKDGFDVLHSVSYSDIAGGPYTPDTTAVYPNNDVTTGRVVVASVSTNDGVGGGMYSTNYAYFWGVQNVVGRGFMGYGKIETVDSRNGMKRVRRFGRDFPQAGMVVEESVYQPDSTLISSNVVTPSYYTLDSTNYNQRYFPYVQSITSNSYEVGGSRNGLQNRQESVTNNVNPLGYTYYSSRTVTDSDNTSPLPLANSAWTTQTWQSAVSSSPSDPAQWCVNQPVSVQTSVNNSLGESVVGATTTYAPDYAHCRQNEHHVAGSLPVDTTFAYDAFGNFSSVSVVGRDENGSPMAPRTTSIAYGSNYGSTGLFPIQEINALGQTITRTFDSRTGQVLTETDPNGIVIAGNTYDSFGRISRADRPDGTYAVYAYSPCGAYQWNSCQTGNPQGGPGNSKVVVRVQEYDAANSLVSQSRAYHDMFGRPVAVLQLLDGLESRVGREYDRYGRVARETAPCDSGNCAAFWTENGYDLIGRIASQSRPQSQLVPDLVTTTFTYAGRTQTIIDPQAKVTTKILDANGQVRRSQDNDGYYQDFSYDAGGNLKQVADSGGTLFTADYAYGILPFKTSSFDADLGTWGYQYNTLGELASWTDAKGQAFRQTYDALSRVTSRIDNFGQPDSVNTYWTWGDSAGSHNIGRLASVSMPGYSEGMAYDSLGRPVTQTVTADGSSYAIDFAYNNRGMLDTLTYPVSTSATRVKVKYAYGWAGALASVTDWTTGAPGTVYWSANSRNARGQTTQQTLGNGVITSRDFDAVTGQLNYIHSGTGGNTAALQNLSYAYDLVGNVTQRQENTLGLTENFCYDNLYRLTESKLGGSDCASPDLHIEYHPTGNIKSRSDMNAGAEWSYAGMQRHAVTDTGTGLAIYAYDANGNMTSRTGSTITWTSFNYPKQLATATESTVFSYGPDRQYYKQEYTGPAGTETTHYIGGLLERVETGTSTDWRHSILAEGQVVALVSRSTSGNAVYYPLEDNQGSASTMTDGSGGNLVRQSYAPFGAPRDGSAWAGSVSSGDQAIINNITRRGYTGHSMLGSMGLIHMNGRVQDAVTGRFLSPDPNIPDPGFTQSYNRYAYVYNNPLTFTDPSGFGCERGGDGTAVYGTDGALDELCQVDVEACRAGTVRMELFAGIYFCVSLGDTYSGNPAPSGGGGGTATGTRPPPLTHRESEPQGQFCTAPALSTAADRPYSGPSAHEYVVETKISVPLTPQQQQRLQDLWRNGPNAAPGIFPGIPDFFPTLLAGLPLSNASNWIYISPIRGGWTNVTLGDHYFKDGTVKNTVLTVDGVTTLRTVGAGNTPRWLQNDVLGSAFFKLSQLEAVAALMGAPRVRIGPAGLCN